MITLPQLSPNEYSAVREYVNHIHNDFPGRILAVILFGSKARGDAGEESDIDLFVLVDMEDHTLRSDLWRIASDVSLEHNVVLSVRVFAQERWAETRRIRLPLFRSIEANGILLTSETPRN